MITHYQHTDRKSIRVFKRPPKNQKTLDVLLFVINHSYTGIPNARNYLKIDEKLQGSVRTFECNIFTNYGKQIIEVIFIL